MRLAKYLVVRRDGTVPRWPWFVLGGRDQAARDAMRFYLQRCRELRYDPAYLDALEEVARSFEADTGTLTRPDQHEQRESGGVKGLLSNAFVTLLLEKTHDHVFDAIETILRKAMGR